jgi:NADH-quinone oxidoreductase subunit M
VTAFFLMVFSVAAVALPLTSSFVGEFLVIIGSWSAFPTWTLVSMTGVVLGAVYTLTAYMKTMFGPAHDTVPLRRSDIRGGDALVLISLVAAVVALGVVPGKLLSLVDSSLSTQLKMYRTDSRASMKDKVFREQRFVGASVVQAITVTVVSNQDKAQAL